MSKLIPTVRLVATFQCTEPLRTLFIFPRHTGTSVVVPKVALTGWTTQPSQPFTLRVSVVFLTAPCAWPSTAGTTAKAAAAKVATVRMRRPRRCMTGSLRSPEIRSMTLATSAPTGTARSEPHARCGHTSSENLGRPCAPRAYGPWHHSTAASHTQPRRRLDPPGPVVIPVGSPVAMGPGGPSTPFSQAQGRWTSSGRRHEHPLCLGADVGGALRQRGRLADPAHNPSTSFSPAPDRCVDRAIGDLAVTGS